MTIPLSHYCERARWALDWCGVEYREEHCLQGFHLRAVKKAGGKRTAPVLAGDGWSVGDSASIVVWADANAAPGRTLYPAPHREAIGELERSFEGELGVEARRWVYHRMLPHRRLLLRYNAGRAPRHQRATVALMFPVLRRTLVDYFAITDENVDAGLAAVRGHLDRVAALLADGRRYLTGDRYSAADLTFASLAALFVMPPEYGAPMPPIEELPAPLAAEVQAFRAHPGGAFAMRLYAQERKHSPAS
ncbi:MAG TPA: glutathione S-transferase N-terminal domain-containing protein [Kofleriaceae bacterium]|nr:glutathione S-transferase N-terminal domain-containing protein [Kofleriaceae bacterium]